MAAPAAKSHLAFFPFPSQGHVTPAFQLARLLHHCHGFDVTFVHTEHNRRRLLRARGPGALAGEPGFRFAAVPDGLPPSDEDAARDVAALLLSLPTMVPHFKELVLSELPAASCRRLLVSDVDPILRAAQEIGLPCVTFWTTSASSFMVMQQVRHLVARGLVPLKAEEWIPGQHGHRLGAGVAQGHARLRDFPTFIRTTDPDDAMLALTLRLTECYRTVPSAVVFHTFEELESQVISAMSDILPPIYAIGPLPLLLREAGGDHAASTSAGYSLSKEDRACLDWLDGKRPNSVVFASFGSLVKLTSEQLAELAWGLASSGYEFLWVIRSDQQATGAAGGTAAVLPPEFLAETEGRGCVTSWCPQEAVLRHGAVGAFLTHCGWNSMLESVCAGVPMLCWPFAADQQTNSRMACTEWRVGVELSEDPGREEVEAAIRQVMGGGRGEEMRSSAAEWKDKAALAARPGSSSWVNQERVVDEVLAPLMDKKRVC
ncbi:7-deoxyloganetin glucosyltransferase-like [Panicum miliaceum]|uniref:Glycosyltransferase n=1 Tax=Panicum miliaceum TaxID=4540 RepID=A0A3L6RQM8_PANMI|nr:7-deoxyloganetin glucosyltransferase-like [Panicum miliaceum]